MAVKAPRCKNCGAVHWLNEPHVYAPTAANLTVTPKVTPEPAKVMEPHVYVGYLGRPREAQLQARVTLLEAEVAALRDELRQRHMTDAARAKRYRERQRRVT